MTNATKWTGSNGATIAQDLEQAKEGFRKFGRAVTSIFCGPNAYKAIMLSEELDNFNATHLPEGWTTTTLITHNRRFRPVYRACMWVLRKVCRVEAV